jgi:tetratricopeptide (TPR) repeat protein
MWWGLSCARTREGVPVQTLSQYGGQLERHLEWIVRAHADNVRMRNHLIGLAKSIIGFVPGPGEAMAVAEFGMQFYEFAHDAVRRAAGGRADPYPRPAKAADPGRAPLVAKTVELLQLVANRRLPVVIVVDDAHDADETLVALLNQIFAGPLPVALLCVLTAWPDQLAQQRRAGLGSWLIAASQQDSWHCQRQQLRPLELRDLDAIVRSRAKATDASVSAAFARRADGNPLVLEGLLQRREVMRATRDLRIELSPQRVATLKNTQRALMEERWETMPADVQEAVCLCTLQGREAVRELVQLAQEVVGSTSASSVDEALNRAADPHGWVRRLGALLRFAEQYTLEIATGKQEDFFDSQHAAAGRRSIAERIAGWKRDRSVWAALSVDVRSALLAIHVEIARAGDAQDLLAAAESAREVAVAAFDGGAYQAALGLAREGSAWARQAPTRDAELELACRLQEARAEFALGNRAVGKRMLEEVLAEAEGALGRDCRLTLEARNDLAGLLVESGDWRRARKLLEQLVADSQRALGPTDDNTLDARTNLAIAMISAGEFEQARELLEALLPVRREHFPAHPDTIQVGVLLAELSMLDNPERAREVQQQAVEAAEAALSKDHPHVIAARSSLALTLRQLGYYREAKEIQEGIVADYRRTLGERHEKTLVEQINLSETLVIAGDPRASVRQQEAARALEQALGAKHPQVLAARRAVAEAAATLGDWSRARSLLDGLLADHEQVVGPGHPFTGAVRRALANVLLQSAEALVGDEPAKLPNPPPTDTQPAEKRACQLLEGELAERYRALGPVHWSTLVATVDLAIARARLGQEQDGLQLLERMVRETEAASGAESAEALTGRAALADVLFTLGQYEAAEERYAEVSAGRARVLGPDHPDTLAVRFMIGRAQYERGMPDAALAVYQEVLIGLERTRGPNHPQTIVARATVADTAFALEDYELARTAYERLVEAREEVLGPEHLLTLSARYWLAQTLAKLDQPVSARRLLDAVIKSYRQVAERAEEELPPGHPFIRTTKGQLSELLEARGKTRQARLAAPTVGGVLSIPCPRGWYLEERMAVLSPDRLAGVRIETEFVPPGVLGGRLPRVRRWLYYGLSFVLGGVGAAAYILVREYLPAWMSPVLALAVVAAVWWLLQRGVPLASGTAATSRRYGLAQGRERAALAGYREVSFRREALLGPRRGHVRRFEWQTPEELRIVQTERYRVRGWNASTFTTTMPVDLAEVRGDQLDQVLDSIRVERLGWVRRAIAPLLRLLGKARTGGVLRARVPVGWLSWEQLTLTSKTGRANVIATLEQTRVAFDAQQWASLQGRELAQFPGFEELEFAPAEVFGGRQGFVRAFRWRPESGDPVAQWQAYHAEAGRNFTATGTCRMEEAPRWESSLSRLVRQVQPVD